MRNGSSPKKISKKTCKKGSEKIPKKTCKRDVKNGSEKIPKKICKKDGSKKKPEKKTQSGGSKGSIIPKNNIEKNNIFEDSTNMQKSKSTDEIGKYFVSQSPKDDQLQPGTGTSFRRTESGQKIFEMMSNFCGTPVSERKSIPSNAPVILATGQTFNLSHNSVSKFSLGEIDESDDAMNPVKFDTMLEKSMNDTIKLIEKKIKASKKKTTGLTTDSMVENFATDSTAKCTVESVIVLKENPEKSPAKNSHPLEEIVVHPTNTISVYFPTTEQTVNEQTIDEQIASAVTDCVQINNDIIHDSTVEIAETAELCSNSVTPDKNTTKIETLNNSTQNLNIHKYQNSEINNSKQMAECTDTQSISSEHDTSPKEYFDADVTACNLKLLSQVKQDDKLCLSSDGKHLEIDMRTGMSFRRFFTGDGRNRTHDMIKLTIDSAEYHSERAIDQILKTDKVNATIADNYSGDFADTFAMNQTSIETSKEFLKTMTFNISGALDGMRNLPITYRDDSQMLAKLQMLNEKTNKLRDTIVKFVGK